MESKKDREYNEMFQSREKMIKIEEDGDQDEMVVDSQISPKQRSSSRSPQKHRFS